jgi:signal transduction histidine kinase/ActR/RegA family two-component response regulator
VPAGESTAPGSTRMVAYVSDATSSLDENESERAINRSNQTQRLESLGLLAGSVAHDFNNLLSVILNYTTMVTETVDEALAADDDVRWRTARADLDEVVRASRRALGLTRQLLAFGRREVVQPRALDVNSVLVEVEAMLRMAIGEHIQVILQPARTLNAILADPGKLEQIIVNVALNARDAMPGGGIFLVETANIDVDGTDSDEPSIKPGTYVRLRVSDSGTGMTAAVRARALEPFFTTKPKDSGTGLGLATVYGIVTQAGGHLRLDSQPGLGTTLTFLFPALTGAIIPTASSTQFDTAIAATVLVVEDDESLRNVIVRILERSGYAVLAAADGESAMQIASEYLDRIDLLVTDAVMPTMLGAQLAVRLTKVRPDIGVLFMSGYGQSMAAAQATVDENLVVLDKPFTDAELLEGLALALLRRVREQQCVVKLQQAR